MQQLAVKEFTLDYNDFNIRHAIAFETYEIRKLTSEEYLDIAVFYESDKKVEKKVV